MLLMTMENVVKSEYLDMTEHDQSTCIYKNKCQFEDEEDFNFYFNPSNTKAVDFYNQNTGCDLKDKKDILDDNCTKDNLNLLNGCTDNFAKNYQPLTKTDTGTCEYDTESCIKNILDNTNCNVNLEKIHNYFHDNNTPKGCTYKEATNKGGNDSEGKNQASILPIIDDGSCIFDNSGKEGCIDSRAKNYSKDNTYQKKGTLCVYNEGCKYKDAENFNKNAVIDNDNCKFNFEGKKIDNNNNDYIYIGVIVVLLIVIMGMGYFMTK